MKTLVTHVRPHLDDICAMWLMLRYASEARGAKLEFIVTNAVGGKVKDDPDYIYIGVGRGKYDEHKGDVGQCATTLVFNDLKGRATWDDIERRALERIVAWVLEEDTGKLSDIPYREFSVPLILQGEYAVTDRDSKAVTELGIRILDALFSTQKNMVRLDDDWAQRIEFDSRFGRAVAMSSFAREVENHAYAKGFDLVVFVNPDMTYHNIRAKAGTAIDLTSVHEDLKKREPEAGWYFHHSKKMLICGGELAPDVKPSKLTLEQMIELVR
jgi:hypothetical protein